MTLVPFTECCLKLGVDPKTLRFWLKAAHLSCCLHPADARLKCLTPDQLTQLAQLHNRPLPASTGATAALPSASPAPSDESFSAPVACGEVADLRQQLILLQALVSTLQTQVTELALALLRSSSSLLCSPLPLVSSPPAHAILAPTPRSVPAVRSAKAQAVRQASPAASQPPARSRAQPLIELRADGTYVAISPTQGVLSLVPDSPEWFAWLASLTTFSFRGKLGCYSATRKFRHGQRIQSWMVHRSLHGRSCSLYLGQTHTLTVARLEDMAAAVLARLTGL